MFFFCIAVIDTLFQNTIYDMHRYNERHASESKIQNKCATGYCMGNSNHPGGSMDTSDGQWYCHACWRRYEEMNQYRLNQQNDGFYTQNKNQYNNYNTEEIQNRKVNEIEKSNEVTPKTNAWGKEALEPFEKIECGVKGKLWFNDEWYEFVVIEVHDTKDVPNPHCVKYTLGTFWLNIDSTRKSWKHTYKTATQDGKVVIHGVSPSLKEKYNRDLSQREKAMENINKMTYVARKTIINEIDSALTDNEYYEFNCCRKIKKAWPDLNEKQVVQLFTFFEKELRGDPIKKEQLIEGSVGR